MKQKTVHINTSFLVSLILGIATFLFSVFFAGVIHVKIRDYTLNGTTETVTASVKKTATFLAAAPEGYSSAGLNFTYNETLDGYIVSEGVSSGLVEIPSTYNDGVHSEKPVKGIAEEGFLENTIILSVYISSSVLEIGEGAFFNAVNLASVLFEENSSLHTISHHAFSNTAIAQLTIPASVSSLAIASFSDAPLQDIVFEDGSQLTVLENAFSTSHLVSVHFGDNSNLQVIESGALSNAANLNTVNFGENSVLTTIGSGAFYEAISLEEITLPSSLTTIGSMAFYGTAITSITIPSDVELIESAAFANIPLQTIIFEDNSKLETVNGGVFATDQLALVNFGTNSSLKTIGDGAFWGAINLTQITIPGTVTTIGNSAFGGSGLNHVTIPSAVSELGYSAFAGVPLQTVTFENNSQVTSVSGGMFGLQELTSIHFGNNSALTIIDSGSFTSATKLTSVNFGTNSILATIGGGAFAGATNLTGITLPASLTVIEGGAFNGTGLSHITVPANVNTIGGGAFTGTPLQTITFANGSKLLHLGSGMFETSQLTHINFGENGLLETIGGGVFGGAVNLTDITLPQGLLAIGSGAFNNAGLTDLTIPSSVNTIEGGAFMGMPLQSLTFADGSNLTTITYSMFETSQLTYINFGNNSNLVSITDGAFNNAINLETVIFGNNSKLETIGNSAFYYTNKLTNLTLPNSLKTLGYTALASTGITSLTLPNGLQTIEERALEDTAITELTIPSSVTYIGANVFYQFSDGNQTTNVIKTIRLMQPNPLLVNIHEQAFSDIAFVHEDFKILVPSASVEAYKTADNWEIYADYIYAQQNIVTLQALSAVSKEYDGNVNAVVLNGVHYVLLGVNPEDEVNLLYTGAEFNSATVSEADAVTLYGLSLDNENYMLEITTFSLSGTITKKDITISGTGTITKEFDGTTNTVLTLSNIEFHGVFVHDVVNLTADAEFNSANVAQAHSVIVSNLSIDNDNYNLTTTTFTVSATITPKSITVTGIGTISKVYDSEVFAEIKRDNYEFTGLLNEDVAELSNYTAAFDSKNVWEANAVTVNNLSLSNANYALTNSSFTLDAHISPKNITVSGVGTFIKTYDGTTDTMLVSSHYEFTGVLDGDAVHFTGYNAYFNSAQVQSANIITYSNLIIDNGNYNLTNTTFNLNGQITPKTITVQGVGIISKTYDGTPAAQLLFENYAFSGVINGDAVALSAYAATYNSTQVQSADTVTVTNLVINNSNYQLSTPSFTLAGTITKKDITVSGVGIATKTYDKTTTAVLQTSNYAFVGVVNSDSVVLSHYEAEFNSENVVSAALITVHNLAIDNANYHLITTEFTLAGAITPTTVQVVFTTPVHKVFDGTTAVNFNASQYTIQGVITGDVAEVLNIVAHFNSANVTQANLVTISQVTLSNSNYVAGEVSALSGTISPKQIVVKIADNLAKVKGQSDPSLTYEVEGLIEGTTLVGKLSREEGENVGTYKILPGTLTSELNPNYEFTYELPELVIERNIELILYVSLGVLATALIALAMIQFAINYAKKYRKPVTYSEQEVREALQNLNDIEETKVTQTKTQTKQKKVIKSNKHKKK